MIRVGTLFWLVLVSAVGFAMFGVKYQVQALEDELARTTRATNSEQHEMRVLGAEWAYLTRPDTLEAMNRRFLSLVPITTKQLHTTLADIPMRPAPPPVSVPSEATAVVAAAGPQPPPVGPQEAPGPAPAPPQPQGEHAGASLPEKAPPQLAKAERAKANAKLTAPRRARSLDDLIAQIVASR